MESVKTLSAAALVAMTGVAFTACSNEDEVESPAPTLTGETVKARFALSLPSNSAVTHV